MPWYCKAEHFQRLIRPNMSISHFSKKINVQDYSEQTLIFSASGIGGCAAISFNLSFSKITERVYQVSLNCWQTLSGQFSSPNEFK